jgi:hypothetical protein
LELTVIVNLSNDHQTHLSEEYPLMRFSSLNRARSYFDCTLQRHVRVLSHGSGAHGRLFVSSATSSRGKASEEDNSGIKHFERVYDPEQKEFRVQKEPDSNKELVELKARIKELEKELKNDEELGILAAFEGEDRERAAQILNNNSKQRNQPSPRQPVAVLNIPVLRRQRPYLDKLNKYLAEAQTPQASSSTRKELWRWYTRSKQHLPPFLYLMPQPVWRVLWDTLNQTSKSNLDRWAHLKVISEDIIAAGHELTNAQKMAYIEALHFEGQPETAVEVWGNEVVAIGMDMKEFQEFWALGVRIFAAQGDPDRAQKTAHMLLGSKGGTNIRVLLPVISAWTKKGGSVGFRNAWSLYMQVKERLGSDIKIEDYDAVSMSFLNAGKKDLALAVFKDMMLTGDPEGPDSLVLYKKAMGLIGGIQSISVDAEEAKNISLEAMTVLPRKFQNKFFYGSWIKKLIGMGEVDAAASVAQLMYDRGIQPAPKHMNGIIGAWLRIGDENSQQKAEDLALAMIGERKASIQQRNSGSSSQISVQEDSKAFDIKRHYNVPPATMETFCVLATYYTRTDRHKDIKELQESIYGCDLTPNAEFMNRYLYSSLRSGGLGEVWKQYKKMTNRSNYRTRADMSTFGCLWDCMAIKRGRISKAASDGDFPLDSRALFGEMQRWWKPLKPIEHAQDNNTMATEIYDNVLRCFGIGPQADVAGMIVSMFSMRELQGLFPGDSTARTILSNLVEIREESSPAVPRKRRKLSNVEKTNKKDLSEALKHIQEGRIEYLGSVGITLDALDEKRLGEEKLVVITDFLKAILRQSLKNSESIEKSLRKAAWEMDVPFVDMEDHLDSAA